MKHFIVYYDGLNIDHITKPSQKAAEKFVKSLYSRPCVVVDDTAGQEALQAAREKSVELARQA